MHRLKDKINYHVMKQIWFIFTLFTVFVFCASTSKANSYPFFSIKPLVTIGLETIFSSYMLFRYRKDIFRKRKIEFSILILLVVTASFRIVQFYGITRWDSYIYTGLLQKGCREFELTWESFFSYFNALSHPTCGYMAICAIGEFLFPQQMIGIHLVNLTLSLAAVYYLTRIFCILFPCNKLIINVLYAFAISNVPVFLGTFSYFQPDYGVAIFFVFVIYAYLSKHYIMAFFWTVILMESKESGIIFAAGFWGTLIFWSFVNKIRQTQSKRLKTRILLLLGGSIVLLIVVGYIIMNSWGYGGGISEMLKISSTGYNCFDIRHPYIDEKAKQIFVLNFSWIYCCLIVIGIVGTIIKRKHIQISEGYIVFPIAVSTIGYIVFELTYVSALLPRYDVVLQLSLALLACIGVDIVFKSISAKQIITILLSGLLLCEAFLTIDPVTKHVFERMETGALSMIYTSEGAKENVGDFLVYNYQYTFLDRAFDKLLREQSYAGKDIFVYGYRAEYAGGDNYQIFWDAKKQERTYIASEDTIPINPDGKVYNDMNVLHKQLIQHHKSTEAIMITCPVYPVDEEELIHKMSKVYEVGERQEISDGLFGKLYYYPLTLKVE